MFFVYSWDFLSIYWMDLNGPVLTYAALAGSNTWCEQWLRTGDSSIEATPSFGPPLWIDRASPIKILPHPWGGSRGPRGPRWLLFESQALVQGRTRQIASLLEKSWVRPEHFHTFKQSMAKHGVADLDGASWGQSQDLLLNCLNDMNCSHFGGFAWSLDHSIDMHGPTISCDSWIHHAPTWSVWWSFPLAL